MMIRCVGTQRFRVLRSEQQKFGLWVADVDMLADDTVVPVPDDLAFTREALQTLVRDIEHNVEQSVEQSGESSGEAGAEVPMLKPYRWDDCGWLANRWCELLPLKPELKHRLMALDGPVLRLELVADTLGQMGLAPPR